jgi:putative membrane protein
MVQNKKNLIIWLDVVALFAWGLLLIKYWLTNELVLLIHPNYFWLVRITGICLLIVSLIKSMEIIKKAKQSGGLDSAIVEHITLLPKGWSSSLLIITAVLGLIISPQILNAQNALQRGVTETLPLTRSQPQSFRAVTKPEDRSLIDWIRTLNAYPEPDAYNGQKAKLEGFVVHLPQLPENYLLISRFVLTCCAVDAYPVGIPVKLNTSRQSYPPDTWLEIQGEMTTETLNVDGNTLSQTNSGKRQLILVAKDIKEIDIPADPYDY